MYYVCYLLTRLILIFIIVSKGILFIVSSILSLNFIRWDYSWVYRSIVYLIKFLNKTFHTYILHAHTHTHINIRYISTSFIKSSHLSTDGTFYSIFIFIGLILVQLLWVEILNVYWGLISFSLFVFFFLL